MDGPAKNNINRSKETSESTKSYSRIFRPRLVAFGASAGGLRSLKTILGVLGANFSIPAIIVQHRSPDSDDALVAVLQSYSQLPVSEAEERHCPQEGKIYVAPARYHLYLEKNHTFSFSVDEKVNFSRPSIDLFLLSASDLFRRDLVTVILSGANGDGGQGAEMTQRRGGQVLIENPEYAEYSAMPKAAMAYADLVLRAEEIGKTLAAMAELPKLLGPHE